MMPFRIRLDCFSNLTALEDVENALVAYAQDQYRRQSLTQATQAAERAVDLALKQYSSGIIDFQDTLEAQRSLLSFQDQLAESDGAVTSNLISLYKALGGGWTPMMAETALNTCYIPEKNCDSHHSENKPEN